MTHWLSSLANGRLILSLEGGYNVNSISYAMTMCTKALLGDPLTPLESDMVPCPSAVSSICNVLQTHKRYWPNLVFQKSLPQESILPKAKVPRAKPTQRLSCQDDFPKVNGSANEEKKDDEVVQLEIDLDNLKIKECVNPDKDKQGDFNRPNDSGSGASGSGNGTNLPRTSSGQQAARGTLMDYLHDNLQVCMVSGRY